MRARTQSSIALLSLALATSACAQEPPADAGLSIATPQWETLPQPVYPAAARATGVTEGSATLQCPLLRDGALGDCRLVRETPAGLGFGQAALDAARETRAAPPDPWTPGMEVGFTVRFASSEE